MKLFGRMFSCPLLTMNQTCVSLFDADPSQMAGRIFYESTNFALKVKERNAPLYKASLRFSYRHGCGHEMKSGEKNCFEMSKTPNKYWGVNGPRFWWGECIRCSLFERFWRWVTCHDMPCVASHTNQVWQTARLKSSVSEKHWTEGIVQ